MIQRQLRSGYAGGGEVPLPIPIADHGGVQTHWQPTPQPDPSDDEKKNLSGEDRKRIAQGIPYSPDGQAYAPDAYMQARVGLAAGGPVQAPDDTDTVYPSTAPAWTAGGYAAALGLAGNADQGYARGGPVEPAGANFRRILAHNRRRFGLHQQPAGYAEGGAVEDYDNGDYAPPTYDPNQDAAMAAPADDAAPVTSTLQDPDFNERLVQRTRRPSAKQPPTTDEPPSADTNIVKLLGQAAQREAEDVGSAVGRGVSAVGRGVADTTSDIGGAIADRYGSMKDRLAAYARGDNGHPPEQVQQLIRDKEAADPGASHNDNIQSVFDDFISQYKHDDAGNFVQSLRQPYDQARAVSQAALAQGNIDASVKAFEHAHNLLPNDTNLKLDQQPDGMIRATVAERGGDAQTLTLTPQQYSDWIHSSGSQLDHVGDLGTGRSLNIASQNTAPSQISPQTGYSPANIAQARETAADALNPSATTGYEPPRPQQQQAPQQLVNPPYTEKELYGFGFGGQSVEAIKRAGGYTNALANSLARFLPPGFLKDPGNRANLEAMSDSLIRQKAIGLQPPEIETRDALKSVAQTLLDKANAARTQSSRAPLSPAAPDGVHEHPEISTPGYIRPDDPKLYRQPPSQPDLRPLSPDQSRLGPTSTGQAVPYSRAVEEALAVPSTQAAGSLFGAPHNIDDRLTPKEIEGARTAPDRGALLRDPNLLAQLPQGYFDTLEGRAAMERLVRTNNVPTTDPRLLADRLLQMTHPESLSSPEDWQRSLDAIGGRDTRTGLLSITDQGGREIAQEAHQRSKTGSSDSTSYRDRPPSYFETPLGKSYRGGTGQGPYYPEDSTPIIRAAPRAPARTYTGPQGEERTGPNRAVVPRGRRSDAGENITPVAREAAAPTGYNQPPVQQPWGTPAPPYPQRPQPQQRPALPPPNGRSFTPNFNQDLNAPGSAAPAPFQAGPNDPLYNQPPSYPRPDQFGRATYPGGLRLTPSTDPRQQVLLGPRGEVIAGIPANQSLSAEDAATKYQYYNERQLEQRLRQGDPVAVAALTRTGSQDFSKPLPPPQPATPESMAAAKAEMVKRQMIRPDPPSAFEQRLAQETNPAVRKALIDQQGLTQRNQATIQQKAQATAELQLSKREQNVMQNYRSNRTNGVPPNPEEEAVAKKLGQLTLEAMGRQGAQPSAAPATRAPTASAQPPAAAIQALRLNPSLRGQFDAFYGQGAAAQALGGP